VTALAIGLGLTAGMLGVREWLRLRTVPARGSEPFDGTLYRVGKAVVAERESRRPRVTVIAMHGFVENLRYFTHFYRDPQIQLILVNSCDYHVPVSQPRFREAPWAQAPRAPRGSIEYDAQVLVQALEHLPRTAHVRVHGHSRGGAVTLEAAALRPDLFERVEVILEAPVLPQAQLRAPLPPLGLWLLPFLAPLWRREPISDRNRRIWGPLNDPRKREMIESYPFNPRRTATASANLRSMRRWIVERDVDIYRHVRRGAILLPSKDRVLDVGSMRASAERAEALQLIDVPGCSHFVAFDRPDAIPPLPGG
jgi:pimeloyl-ACP methyl ester carboxylesterase